MNRRTKRWFWMIAIPLLVIAVVGVAWLLGEKERYLLVAEIEPRGSKYEDFRKRLGERSWYLVLRNDGTFSLDSPLLMNAGFDGFANEVPDFYFTPQAREDSSKLIGTYDIRGEKLTLSRPPFDSGDFNPSLVPRIRTLRIAGKKVEDDLVEIPGVRLVWVAK